MEQQEKKMNVKLLIVLLILVMPVGIIYAIACAIRASRRKRQVVSDGFVAKMIGAILNLLVFAPLASYIVYGLVYLFQYGVFQYLYIMPGVAFLASVFMIVCAIITKKTKNKLFNTLYMICLILICASYYSVRLYIPILALWIVFICLIPLPGSIIGLAGSIKCAKLLKKNETETKESSENAE